MRCSQRLGDLGGLVGLGGFGPPAFFLAFFIWFVPAYIISLVRIAIVS